MGPPFKNLEHLLLMAIWQRFKTKTEIRMTKIMKERPIIFNELMVRAILEGRKTQTRRLVKLQPSKNHSWNGYVVESTDRKNIGCASWGIGEFPLKCDVVYLRCPYGNTGDLLWVKEIFHIPGGFLKDYEIDEIEKKVSSPQSLGVCYRSDASHLYPTDGGWQPSIYMPRYASRISLEIINIRVERLQDINEKSLEAEGLRTIEDFIELWDAFYGLGSWQYNPWVWMIEFKRVESTEKINDNLYKPEERKCNYASINR